ncbi:MAG: hypothetical protein FGM33_07715 [Candidatus Kapabacteria bacterium]|nr:hypothetical protein [Candidatus Kapabacteria bacterium]
MSKGGAGKVYFVLYLAVILELLIIIVERDEAEEHLIRKQKEAEEIVEAVMAQLNTGFGASGVNALPQDEITLLDKSVMVGVSEKDRPKEERAYQVRVSTVKIKDILGDDLPEDESGKRRRIEEIIRLFNVSNLNLYDTLNGTNQVEALTLDLDPTWLKRKTDEVYRKIGGLKTITDVPEFRDGFSFLKTIVPDSADYKGNTEMAKFRFSPHLTYLDKVAFENGIKVFEYTFKQTSQGLYRVLLQSKTNNILGVSGLGKEGGEKEDDVISIGTIQLTRKQLSKVEKRLRSTLGSEVEALCEKFGTSSEYKYPQFSSEVDASVEKLKHEDLGLRSKSEKIRRAELLKNITVLLHGDANQMEQNNPNFAFEVFVKKPNIERAEPCIADLIKAQRVLSGLKKIVIPFTVNNFRNEAPQVSISPNDATVRVVPVGAGSSSGGGSMRNQAFEIHIEGASTGAAVKDYTVKITNLKMCDDSDPSATVQVFPADLKNKNAIDAVMEKRVTIGKPLRLPIEPSSGGEIPSNQFILSYNLNGESQEITGTTPLQITVACIPKALSGLNVKVKWRYKPLNSQYTEEVELYDRTVTSAKQSSPEIIIANTSENWDGKNMRLVVSGIEVVPPRIDCNKTADDKEVKVDVKLDKPSVGKYQVIQSIEPEGSGRYRLILTLKGPRMKFPGETIDATITASIGSVIISETKTVSIPEFR